VSGNKHGTGNLSDSGERRMVDITRAKQERLSGGKRYTLYGYKRARIGEMDLNVDIK
jgi:hypothetical protein